MKVAFTLEALMDFATLPKNQQKTITRIEDEKIYDIVAKRLL